MNATPFYSLYLLKGGWSAMPPIYGLMSSITTPNRLPQELIPRVEAIFREAAQVLEEVYRSYKDPSPSLAERINSVRNKAFEFLNERHPGKISHYIDQSDYIRLEDNISRETAEEAIKSVGLLCRLVETTIKNHRLFTKDAHSIPESWKDFHLTKYGEELLGQLYEHSTDNIVRAIGPHVLLCQLENPEHTLFTVKTVSYSEKAYNPFYNEAFYSALCEHSDIVPFGVVKDLSENSFTIQTPYFEQGSISMYSFDSQSTILYLLYPVLKALSHMHSLGIAHNNVKPQSIFMRKSSKNPKVCKGVLGNLKLASKIGLRISPGPILYLPPETILNCYNPIPVFSSKDIWLFGMTLLEILTGHPGLDERNPELNPSLAVRRAIEFYKTFTNETFADYLNEFMRRHKWEKAKDPDGFLEHIVRMCLNFNPEKRPTAKQLEENFRKQIKLNSLTTSQQQTYI